MAKSTGDELIRSQIDMAGNLLKVGTKVAYTQNTKGILLGWVTKMEPGAVWVSPTRAGFSNSGREYTPHTCTPTCAQGQVDGDKPGSTMNTNIFNKLGLKLNLEFVVAIR